MEDSETELVVETIDSTLRIMSALTEDAPAVMNVLQIAKATGLKLDVVRLIIMVLADEGWVLQTDRGFVTMGNHLRRVDHEDKRKSIFSYLADVYQFDPALPRVKDSDGEWAEMSDWDD